MELFPDGGFVRLQSRGNSKYVHADVDWEGVSLRPLGVGTAASLEAVWRVQHVPVNQEVLRPRYLGTAASAWRAQQMPVNQEVVFLLLQNAAYGRYLSFSPYTQAGHRGHRAVQADRTEPPAADNAPLNAFPWWWRVERVDPDHYVRLRYANTQFQLRANGRHRRWNTGVTVAVNRVNRRRRLSTMMQWTVHAVPASSVPIPLPVAPHQLVQIQRGRRGLLFWRRTGNRGPGVHPHPPRMTRHVRASDEGEFDQDHRHWPALDSYNNSVINLRTQLGQLQNDWNGDVLGFTLCIRSGFHGRLMPLVTDLPRSFDPMNIVVLRTGSSAAAALRYPAPQAAAEDVVA